MKIKNAILTALSAALIVPISCKDDTEPANVLPTTDFVIEGSNPYYMDTEISFTDQSTDEDGEVTAWFWDFGDNATSLEQNPKHTYAAKAEYTVSLTVTDDKGDTNTASKTLTIKDIADENIAPVASYTVTKTLVFAGDDVVFTNASEDSDGTLETFAWNFGDTKGTSAEESPTYSFNEAGEYEISLTVTDDLGATHEYKSTVYVAGITWSFPVGLDIESTSPAVGDDGTVYVTLSGKEGVPNIHAINSDGTEKWKKEVGDIIRSSPVISDDGSTVYVASYDDFMYALSTADGSETWSYDVGNNAKYATPGLAADGTLFLGAQTDNVHAVNADGTEKWVFTTGGDVNGSPVIGTDGTLFIHSTDDYLYAIDPTDGSEKWNYLYGSWAGTSLAMSADGSIFVCGEKDSESGVVAGVSATGTELWSITTDIAEGSVSTTGKIDQGGIAIGEDGTVYVGTKGPELLALDPATGAEKWSYTKAGLVGLGTTPAIDDRGYIYIGDDSGLFTVLDDKGNVVFELSLGVKVWSSATIGDDGTVYVGADQEDGTGVFYAINFHADGPANSSWPMRHGNRKHNARL